MTTSERIRILTVDDHPLFSEGLAAVIQNQPDMLPVGQASSGREAIERFSDCRPDITLMDLQLPDMNGIDAMIAIRSKFSQARFIILTTFAGDAEIQRAVEAGARAYLLKTMPPQELMDMIRQVHAGKKKIPSEIAAHLTEHHSDEELAPSEVDVLRQPAGGNRAGDTAEKLFRAGQERDKLRQLETDDLAHVNRVDILGEMAASLAHEIMQPIAAAITSANSCVEWLAHEPPNLVRVRAAALRIDKYGNRAADIINRIRSLYKKCPPQRELVDVNAIIPEVLALLKDEACEYSVAMRTDLAAELPEVMADRVLLQQVFMNLILNAIEAMKDSGGDLTVKSHLQDRQLQCSVTDTGLGLPTEKMDQIFSAFFTTKPQGSGMGLAISRSIVESHGGRLWASANHGRGATFHFTLPLAAKAVQCPAQERDSERHPMRAQIHNHNKGT